MTMAPADVSRAKHPCPTVSNRFARETFLSPAPLSLHSRSPRHGQA